MLYKLLCFLRGCTDCVTKSDASGMWGECVLCGKRHGFVTREAVNRHIDKELYERGGQ